MTTILASIQQRLDDPDLSVLSIADAHHISCRTLHRLFSSRGLTVGGWIRDRRLKCCWRDLADPRLRDRPIAVIAARWGFTSAAHFSRVFRAAYGVTPRERRVQSGANGQRS